MISTTQRSMSPTARVRAADDVQERPAIEPGTYFRRSYVFGRTLAAIMLLPAAPILLLLVVLVRLSSPGSAIYRQVRVGRRGKTFTMYKIRTMRNDAERQTGPTWATTNDPRLTRIGRFIRSIHLDELPQLINVIKGDMALVGPRPERPEFTQILAREIDGYLDRLTVRPGVTGLAQINLPPDTDLDGVRRKLVLDLDYIREAGPGLDLRILCWTALRLFGLRDSITSLFRLHRSVALPAPKASHVHEPDRDVAVLSGIATPHSVISRNGNGQATHDGSSHDRRASRVRPR